jgi:hypothetical protein
MDFWREVMSYAALRLRQSLLQANLLHAYLKGNVEAVCCGVGFAACDGDGLAGRLDHALARCRHGFSILPHRQ